MKIKLIGDMHLGKKFPYTTNKSAAIFEELRYKILAKHTQGKFIQLGDLFDDYSVSDNVLVQGYRWMENCVAALAGNHDVSNNTEKSSAIKLLRDDLGINVAWIDYCVHTIGNTDFHLVPHQLTQDDFEGVLDSLEPGSRLNVLVLHCNYGDRAGVITENYLRTDRAKELSKKFHLIVSGHEHNISKPLKNLIMLGSVMPFSFGEMNTKYVMDYDCETGNYELIPTWVDGSARQVQFQDFLDTPIHQEFIEVMGSLDVSQAAQVNKRIASLYKDTDVIAIKNSTAIYRHEKEADELQQPQDWLSQVRAQCSKEQALVLDSLLGEI